MKVFVSPGDSPKFYALLRDIYGDAIDAESSDLSTFSYSVYKVVSGARIPVEGFVDVAIPPGNYHNPTETYPSNIQGLSTAEKTAGYNVEVFPYKEVDGAWVSPFTSPNSLYELVVNIVYAMGDPALSGDATIDKSFAVQISVGAY